MKVALVLLLAVFGASATPHRLALKATTDGHRIVGGQEATPHEFPFLVDLTRGYHYCGGTIIAPNWIMTAAHCSQGGADDYIIVAGDHDNESWDGMELRREVLNIYVHPDYNSGTFDNDIALMELKVPLVMGENVQAATLPPRDFMPTGDSTVAGWGALTEGGSSPSTVYKVDVPLVDNESCNSLYQDGSSYEILPSMICAGEAGKDSCQGDSGGPMVCDGPDGKVHCGIVSWGIGCAREGFPGVYARTSHFLDFIAETTGMKL